MILARLPRGCTRTCRCPAVRSIRLLNSAMAGKEEHDHHYDLRFAFQGDDLYAETVLIRKRDPYYSTIVIVKLKYKDEQRNRSCQVQT